MKPLMPPIGTSDNLFHDGNPATGVEGTVVTAAHLNNEQDSIRDTQNELIAILTAAALAPDSTAGQLLKALKVLFLLKTDATIALDDKQPKDNTLTALSGKDVVGLLQYLGLSAFISHPSSDPGAFSQVNSPDGSVYLFIANNDSWGAQKADGTSIPLPLERGGSGAGTPSGARAAFGLGDSATKNVGIVAGTVAAGNDSRLVNLKSAANRDVGTGTNQIPDMSGFPSGSGWEKLPNGKIRQWGTLITSTTTTKSTNFPIAFPNACQSLVGTMRDVTQAGAFSLGNASGTAFQANSWSLVDTTTGAVRSSTEIAWVAIGE